MIQRATFPCLHLYGFGFSNFYDPIYFSFEKLIFQWNYFKFRNKVCLLKTECNCLTYSECNCVGIHMKSKYGVAVGYWGLHCLLFIWMPAQLCSLLVKQLHSWTSFTFLTNGGHWTQKLSIFDAIFLWIETGTGICCLKNICG